MGALDMRLNQTEGSGGIAADCRTSLSRRRSTTHDSVRQRRRKAVGSQRRADAMVDLPADQTT
jgi:hypothetical protein